jgi:16S rRNA processing protein RimM
METAWLRFGVLRRPHGVAGEIALAPYNAGGSWPALEKPPIAVLLKSPAGETRHELVACRSVSDGYLVRFSGYPTREEVATLVGMELHLPRPALGELDAAEFFVEELVGCEVFGPNGARLGAVAGTFWNGAQDIMSVLGGDGEERLYPVVPEFVCSFDRAQRRVIVDPHD